jgi:hypothetical protein
MRALRRAALYLAYYDGARRITSEYVAKVVRLRDGDRAFAQQEVVGAPIVRTLPPSPLVFGSSSAVRHGGLLAVIVMICIGVWMASTPGPAPSEASVSNFRRPGLSFPGSEPRATAAYGALPIEPIMAGPAAPTTAAPAEATFSTSATSSSAAAMGTPDPVLGAAAPDIVARRAPMNDGSVPGPSAPFLPERQSQILGEVGIASLPMTIALHDVQPHHAETSARSDGPQIAGINSAQAPAPSAQSASQIAELRGPAAVHDVVAYQGPIRNLTMRRQGRVRIVIEKQGAAVIAQLDTSAGLVGSGELRGRLSSDGHLAASGQLMMGAGPFYCYLTGVVGSDSIIGSASFVRTSGGLVYVSRFALTKSQKPL